MYMLPHDLLFEYGNSYHSEIEEKFEQEVNNILQSIAWAIRTTVNTTTNYSPGQLAFNRDMIIHEPTVADWQLIRAKQRVQQLKDNARENKTRTNDDYKVGDLVLIITSRGDRRGKILEYHHEGPYKVIKAYKNGTVTRKRS